MRMGGQCATMRGVPGVNRASRFPAFGRCAACFRVHSKLIPVERSAARVIVVILAAAL